MIGNTDSRTDSPTDSPEARWVSLAFVLAAGLLALPGAVACSSDDSADTDAAIAGQCPTESTTFDVGDPTGHADPYGAAAAAQARAGRLTDESMIVQSAHGRQKIRVGDFVLANDKVAVVIEDAGLSDGYVQFGGEILAIDKVGSDGRPMGLSKYVESLITLSNETVEPTSVTVMNDGSDGKAAVVRATGQLRGLPFLDGALGALFYRHYGLEVAFDFVLEPGAEKILLRLGIINPSVEAVDFAADGFSDELHGFFQKSHNQLATKEFGFGEASGEIEWAAFISGEWNFAWRLPEGKKLYAELEISGFQYMSAPGFVAKGCGTTWRDHVEIIAGGPNFDGLIEAIRRVDGEAPGREIRGLLVDAEGAPVPNAWVHVEDAQGNYLSRARADVNGAFTAHGVVGDTTVLFPDQLGGKLASVSVSADQVETEIALPAASTLNVVVTDASTKQGMPVRIQVIPEDGVVGWPSSYGVPNERDGRLYQEFAMTGAARLEVPPGEHRVIVSRGFEWEMFDGKVTVRAGETVDLDVELLHSVDSTGVMCADFHIHSHQSADSNDPIPWKVKSAIADGLEIPVSSEHDWVVDFQPVIEDLGVAEWAFGMPSSEMTSFEWGHMGVVPLLPRPDALNNGAINWPGRTPPDVFEEIQNLPEDPILIINHPSDGSFASYFSSSSLDRETGEGREGRWSTNFDAIEVFNSSDFDRNRNDSVTDWFVLLNHGYTFWAVGSSDSHHLRGSPVGYPRTCIDFGHDDPTRLTRDIVRDRIATGAMTISGGLLMTVVGPDGAGPGATVTAGALGIDSGSSADFVVTVQGPSWVQGDTLEIIVDGVTQQTVPLMPLGDGPSNVYVNNVKVNFDDSRDRSWVVFHAKGVGDLRPLHNEPVFAASNPVFYEP
jgi:hypothetical protein